MRNTISSPSSRTRDTDTITAGSPSSRRGGSSLALGVAAGGPWLAAPRGRAVGGRAGTGVAPCPAAPCVALAAQAVAARGGAAVAAHPIGAQRVGGRAVVVVGAGALVVVRHGGD